MSDNCDCIDQPALIARLQRELREAKAMAVHNYHFASKEIDKLSIARCMGSVVILELTLPGGKKGVEPVAIRNGLSTATIAAIKADLKRSFEYATEFKPD